MIDVRRNGTRGLMTSLDAALLPPTCKLLKTHLHSTKTVKKFRSYERTDNPTHKYQTFNLKARLRHSSQVATTQVERMSPSPPIEHSD